MPHLYVISAIINPSIYYIDGRFNNIFIMRKNDMKIAPLSQLYQQKNHYQAHRQKINRIMSSPINNNKEKDREFHQMEIVRQNLCKF